MSEGLRERQHQKDGILEAALMHAAFDGWSRKTLMAAATDLGIERSDALRLFPQGGNSLLDWLDGWADRRMLDAVDIDELAAMPIRRRIATLVRARFEALQPHREAVRRAVAARSVPPSTLQGGRSLWRTVDVIWQTALPGPETDQGISYYTRRATLSGVLVSTLLYWLDDHSEGATDSWAFLDRRIEDVMRFGKFSAQFTGMLGHIPGFRPAAR
ncbi:COQ9 family protein [Geminicoccaceae bacterium 1502E]|nr:COQ9 family protein [Geminicoccaceae bacterium 1502E]